MPTVGPYLDMPAHQAETDPPAQPRSLPRPQQRGMAQMMHRFYHWACAD